MIKVEIVQHLNFLVKTYDEVTKTIAKTLQRLSSLPGIEKDMNPDTLLKGVDKTPGLLTVKGQLRRAIEKQLKPWDVWERWLKNVPGVGPVVTAKLIIYFNYKFIPICKKCGGDLEEIDEVFKCIKCGKSAAGDGCLQFRIEERDFQTISKWWHQMGRHTVDGVMPKRRKGERSFWSSKGRKLGYDVVYQWNMDKDNLYTVFMLTRKSKHQKNHPEWSDGRRHNAAWNEAWKLFLAHFWTVSRRLDGKPVSMPYAGAIMGHTDIIEPFYWDGNQGEYLNNK